MKAPKFVEVPKNRHGFILISREFHYNFLKKDPKKNQM